MNAAKIPCWIETHRRMKWRLAMRKPSIATAAKVQTQQNPRPCRTHFARSEVQEVRDQREEEGGVGRAHASPKLGGGHHPCHKSANKGRPMSPSEQAAKLNKKKTSGSEQGHGRCWSVVVTETWALRSTEVCLCQTVGLAEHHVGEERHRQINDIMQKVASATPQQLPSSPKFDQGSRVVNLSPHATTWPKLRGEQIRPAWDGIGVSTGVHNQLDTRARQCCLSWCPRQMGRQISEQIAPGEFHQEHRFRRSHARETRTPLRKW